MHNDPTAPTRTPSHTQGGARNRQIEDVLDILYRRRWIVAGTLAVVVAAAIAYVFTRTPMYRSAAFVMVDLNRAPGSEGPGITEASPFVGASRTVSTELFILQSSRGIKERVNERLAEDNGSIPPGGVSFSQASRDVASAILVSATSPDPEAAAALANAYAEEYVNQTQTSSRSYLTATREFLEDQAQRLRGELNMAEGQVASQMATSGTATLGANSLIGQLSNLRAQRDEARIRLQTSRYRLGAINQELTDIEPRLAERMSSSTQRRVDQIERRLNELETEYRSTYQPRIDAGAPIDERGRQLQSEIAELEREKSSLSTQFVGEVMEAGGIVAPQNALSYVADLKGNAAQEEIDISGVEGRIGVLNQRIGELEGELSRVPSQSTAMNRANRDRQHAERMYQTVVSQLQQVKIQEESKPGYARILREASVPSFPVGTQPFRTLALALFGGLGLGLVLAVARDKVDNRVHKPEDVSSIGVPVLEAIPDLGAMIDEEYQGAETIEVDGRTTVSELVTLHSPLSPASETYRHLRTAVQFSRPDVLVRTVVVSSAGAGEGKSTTASNLAVTFAQAGRRTVLLDADIRRPRAHDVFGMNAAPGIAQVLDTGYDDPDALRAWLDGSFESSVDNLYVVPTGAVAAESRFDVPEGDARVVVTNPSELLGSPEFRALLDTLLDVVDVVIVDTPPVLAATDAVLLSTQADATLLVVCAGKTKTGDVEQALSHLADVGARVVGAVLNRFSLKHALGYAYTYGHYSRYGPYSKYGPYSGSKADRKRLLQERQERQSASEAQA